MTNREIEIYLERINERMVRAYGRELQPLEREAIRRDIAGTRVCCNCKTQAARWDSLYCSDKCRRAFLTFQEVA